MEDDLNYWENGRWPQFLKKWKTNSILRKLGQFTIMPKPIKVDFAWKKPFWFKKFCKQKFGKEKPWSNKYLREKKVGLNFLVKQILYKKMLVDC